MSSLDGLHNAHQYRRSLAERAEAQGRAPAPGEVAEAPSPPGITRRRWVQLMGASLALGAAGGCRWQKEEILPLAQRPPERTPGKEQQFATAMELAGAAIGLVVTCVDGRPIKIEGNLRHPTSLGATDAGAQAAVLELYDPDRSRHIVERTDGQEMVRTWEEFIRFARTHFGKLREAQGTGLRVLAEASSSPTLARLRSRLRQAFPAAAWHEYEPLSCDNQREGVRRAYGRPDQVRLALDKALVIACLDADLLGFHPAAVRCARQFAASREPAQGTMNRLYAVESCLTLTGAAADHRLAVRACEIARFVAALEAKVLALLDQPRAGQNRAEPAAEQARGPEAIGRIEHSPLLAALAEDLVANRGTSVVAAGPGQPAEVHAAVARINSALGNVGATVFYFAAPEPECPSHLDAIRQLTTDMQAGKVETLLVLGGNPAYDAPADLDFAAAFVRVDTCIHLSLYRNETSRASTWHVPRAHFLESWGDTRADDGTYSVIQPMIAPLFGGKSAIELLAALLGDPAPDGQALVRETFVQIAAETNRPDEDVELLWRRTLHDGLLADSAWRAVAVSGLGAPAPADSPGTSGAAEEGSAGRESSVDKADGTAVPRGGELEIVFCPSRSVYDGRFANNGWLQEMPDPITRLTWGNAALVSPATALELGIEDQTLVRLSLDGRAVEMPACVVPGQADRSVAVQLGYGRTAAGQVGGLVAEGVEPVGVDVYPLRASSAMHFATGLRVEATGQKTLLASVQDHHAIDVAGRKARDERAGVLAREATREHFRAHPDFAHEAVHHPPLESLWSEPEYPGPRWGMAIDLSKCIGCGACVVACQAENNIPIVGPEQVRRGREMHWIRVDRYFRGDAANPQVVVQPVACQHCELAPCEQVCPVAATLHDAEGLNVMVYNRCVGTRYCANNCPYKVRRFNFFDYHRTLADPSAEVAKMAFNPQVTVRSRGVMEKCTYCVQRIKAATIQAKNEGRRVSGDEVQTACQQACPAGAIVFGDLADPQSTVAQWAADPRSYAMLAELNVKPRTVYLARIRNPHPRLEHQAGSESASHG